MDHCHGSMDESIPRYQSEVGVLNGGLQSLICMFCFHADATHRRLPHILISTSF